MALSGGAYQGVFKNPLVAPDMLGVSSGACVGASLGILLNANEAVIQVMAFGGGLLAVFAANMIPKLVRNNSMMALVLAGVIISGLMNAFLGVLKYLADPETQLASITHWQLNSLASVVWKDIAAIGLPILIASAVLITVRWKINILSLGESEARSLGTDIRRVRGLIVVCATVLEQLESPDKLTRADMVFPGFAGVCCVEAGQGWVSPPPSTN